MGGTPMPNIHEIQLRDPSAAKAFTHLNPTGSKGRFIVSEANLQVLRTTGAAVKVLRSIDTAPLEKQVIYPYRNFLYATPDEGALEEICAMLESLRKGKTLPYAVFLGRNPEPERGGFFLDRVGRQRRYQWRIERTKRPEKSLAETFPKLLKLLSDKDTKVVLSFGAGGLRFFAHASVMKFINAIRARGEIDELWGCSGGAFSAYAYAMGALPEDIEQKGYDIYNERLDLKIPGSRFASAAMRLVDRLLPASPLVLKAYATIQLTMRQALAQLVTAKQLEIPFYCTAFNVREEHNDVLTPISPIRKAYQGFIHHAKALESIIASSAIPVVFLPKAIRNGEREDYYIDGSVAEDIPLLPVYRKWMIDKQEKTERREKLLILAINTFPLMAQRPWFKSGIAKRIPFMQLLHYGLEFIDLIMNVRYDEKFESLSQDSRVRVVKVTLPLQTPALLDGRAIPTIIFNAQTHLIQELLKIERSL
jgi:predicted acylesterase/phospholipase RssA